jgi:hypothetical protein
MLRGTASVVAVGLLAACGTSTRAPASVAPATPTPATFSGIGFTVGVPRGWYSETIVNDGASGTIYGLASQDVQLPADGVVPQGVIGIEIGYAAASSVPAQDGDPSTMTPVQLVTTTAGIPQGATLVSEEQPTTTTLDGVTAGMVTFTYTYDGMTATDVDVVAYRDQAVYAIGLEMQPDLLGQGQQALTATLRSWAWR